MNESLPSVEPTKSRFQLIADPDQPNGIRVVGGKVILDLEPSPEALEAFRQKYREQDTTDTSLLDFYSD